MKAPTSPLGIVPFCLLTLVVPAAIVVGNTALGVATPTTIYLQDEISFFDAVWRVVQGQRLGSDFHHILGLGVPEAAASLWRLLGPHYFVLRLAVGLYALLIVVLGFVVAVRQLRRSAGLAAFLCATVALMASGPLVFGTAREFGLAGHYNHLITAALAVLFVQQFARQPAGGGRDYVFLAVTALLLNLLFLVKISGLVVGIGIVGVGFIARGDLPRRIVDGLFVAILLVGLLVLDFALSGAEAGPVFQEYWVAARGRSERAGSALSPNMLPVFFLCGLLACYVASRAGSAGKAWSWRGGVVIAMFGLCQLLLNQTNNILDDLFVVQLAPSAAVALVTLLQSADEAGFWDRPWRYWRLRALEGVSVVQALPLLVVFLVLLPEIGSSLLAGKVAATVLAGRARTLTLTGGTGFEFRMLAGSDPAELDMALSTNQATATLRKLGLDKDRIASLDFANPFPTLLLAPSPKGLPTAMAFTERPAGAAPPAWQEVVGDACIVLEPKRPLAGAEHFRKIESVARPRLQQAYHLIHEDGSWKYWQQNAPCGKAAPQTALVPSTDDGTKCAQAAGEPLTGLALRRSVIGRPVSTERMNRWLDYLVGQFALVNAGCV